MSPCLWYYLTIMEGSLFVEAPRPSPTKESCV
jgi:hypothetical protein